MRSQRQRSHSASTNKTFIFQTASKYMLYGWGSPLLIVTICVTIEFVSKSVSFGYRPQQDDVTSCWISNPLSNLVAFGVPLFVILLLNSFFFVSSALAIRKSCRSLKRRSSSTNITRTVSSMFV